MDPEDVANLTPVIGPSCPIGHKDDLESIVMSGDGSVYVTLARDVSPPPAPVWLVGSDGDEALEVLLNGLDGRWKLVHGAESRSG